MNEMKHLFISLSIVIVLSIAIVMEIGCQQFWKNIQVHKPTRERIANIGDMILWEGHGRVYATTLNQEDGID